MHAGEQGERPAVRDQGGRRRGRERRPHPLPRRGRQHVRGEQARAEGGAEGEPLPEALPEAGQAGADQQEHPAAADGEREAGGEGGDRRQVDQAAEHEAHSGGAGGKEHP